MGSIIFNKGKHFDGNVSNMGKYFELRLEAGASRNLAELSIWQNLAYLNYLHNTRRRGPLLAISNLALNFLGAAR